jgi:hypothetical protein
MYRAAAQVALQKAAEQAFKQQELANNPKSAGGGGDIGGTIGAALLSKFVGTDVMSASQAGAFQAATDKAKGLEGTYLKIAESFNNMVSQTNAAAEKSVLFGKDDKKETKTKSIAGVSAKSLEDRLKEAMDFIDKEQEQIVKGPKEPEGGSDRVLLNALTGETGKKQSDKKLDEDKKGMDNFFKDNKKKFDEAQKAAEGFANTISQEVTGGLMSMWDAMENGESPLKALGNFFADLLKQLAAAVVQAIIFQTVMSALGFGGVASAGGGGGLIGGIGKIFGFAEGGIVSQPTLSMVGEGGQSEAIMPLNKLGNMMNSTFNAGAMSGQGGGGNGQFVLKGNDLVLAMQRSNFSLNVRR